MSPGCHPPQSYHRNPTMAWVNIHFIKGRSISLFQPLEPRDTPAVIDTHGLPCSNNDTTSTRGFRKLASRHTYYRLLIFILYATMGALT